MATKKKTEETDAASVAPDAGAWTKGQTPPPPVNPPGYKLVTIDRPRRVVAEVPDEVVAYSHDNEGNRILVFDGVRCPRGVVNFHGVKCFLDGEKSGEKAGEPA